MLTWPDGALNHEQALVQTSADQGLTWSASVNAAAEGDRPDNPAVAISPNGTDVYLVYNAYLQPFQTTTASPRLVQGVTRHADVGAGGAVGSFTTLHRAAVGDARGSTRTLNRELIYDYQYAAASGTYGATVWIDARDATDCPAVDAYRQSLIDRSPIAAPSPLTDCPRLREPRHLQRLLPRPHALTTKTQADRGRPATAWTAAAAERSLPG